LEGPLRAERRTAEEFLNVRIDEIAVHERSPKRRGHQSRHVDGRSVSGNKEIQLQLFYSYGSNPPLYREWQAYFRNYQPPTLIVWGKNDPIFPAEGAEPYKRDLKNLEFHLLDTGHFALEEDGGEIARYMANFLDKHVKKPAQRSPAA
jgi:pimeloyl-ACP methyl ester carboxylesterase